MRDNIDTDDHRPRMAVLVHGMEFEADGWGLNVWGDPEQGLLGRVPKGVLTFYEFGADTIIFGSGVLTRDDRKESQVTYELLMELWNSLGDFPQFRGVNLDALRSKIAEATVLDMESQDTLGEMGNAIRICEERGLTHLFHISSPSHMPRCIQSGARILETARLLEAKELMRKKPALLATPSDVCYQGSMAKDTLVIEPPHRKKNFKEFRRFHEKVRDLTAKFYPDRVTRSERLDILRKMDQLLS